MQNLAFIVQKFHGSIQCTRRSQHNFIQPIFFLIWEHLLDHYIKLEMIRNPIGRFDVINLKCFNIMRICRCQSITIVQVLEFSLGFVHFDGDSRFHYEHGLHILFESSFVHFGTPHFGICQQCVFHITQIGV